MKPKRVRHTAERQSDTVVTAGLVGGQPDVTSYRVWRLGAVVDQAQQGWPAPG
jgi:hypothetical protein